MAAGRASEIAWHIGQCLSRIGRGDCEILPFDCCLWTTLRTSVGHTISRNGPAVAGQEAEVVAKGILRWPRVLGDVTCAFQLQPRIRMYLGASNKGGSKALSDDARISERGGIKDIMMDNRIRIPL